MQAFYSLSFFKRSLIGVLVSIVAAIFSVTLLTFIFASIEGLSIIEFSNQLSSLGTTGLNVSMLRYMLLTQSISIFLVPAIIMLYALSPYLSTQIGAKVKFSPQFLFGLLGTLLIFIPGINLISALNSNFVEAIVGKDSVIVQLYEKNELILTQVLQGSSYSDLLKHVFFMAVIPALTEEFFFRGMLQTYAHKVMRNKHTAIIVTAIVFSLMHGDLLNFVPRMILGAVFGYVFIWSGSLWVPMLAHFTHNAIVVCVTFYVNNGTLPQTTGEVGDINNIATLGIISLAAFVYISVKSFKRYET